VATTVALLLVLLITKAFQRATVPLLPFPQGTSAAA
jgi:hypothetical protein